MIKQLLKPTVLCIGLQAFHAAATTYYVDVNSTNASPPYTSWATAATSIQDAVDIANAGDTVLVTDGVYQTGGHVAYGDSMNRVTVTTPITVMSVNGPSATTILGAHDPYFEYGTRCAYVTNGAVLAGFTLSGGNIGYGSDDHNFEGAGIYAETGATISNCVITGSSVNTEGQGGGVFQGILINCIISGNSVPENDDVTTIGGGVCYSTLTNCLLFGNSSGGYGGGADESTLVNCTVVNNSGVAGGGTSFCTAINCIVYSNSGNPNYAPSNYSQGTFTYSCTTPDPGGTGNITTDPALVNIADNDYNLQPDSPCINAGNNTYVATATDLAGHPRIVGATVDMGAYEYQAATIALTAQPLSQTNYLGQTAAFSVDAISPYSLTYQWLFDSNSIAGATNTSLVISNLQFAETGYYSVVVSNAFLATNSSSAFLSVIYPPPAIIRQPASIAALLGSNIHLSVTATSYLNMTFQWQLNGTNLTDQNEFSGSSSSNLLISAASAADAGNYDVIVSDGQSSATSSVASVSIVLPVTITLQPTNQTVIAPRNVSLAAAASGTGPLGYEWYFNSSPLTDGGNISGSSTPTLSISGVQVANGGLYQLVVTNDLSAATSGVVTLTVEAAVQITGQPVNEAVLLGGTASLSVSATGTGLSYQWYLDGAPLSDGGGISGSTTANLEIASVQAGNGGDYRVVVSNVVNSVTSSTATLTPLNDPGPSIRYVNVSNSAPASPYLTWSTAATNIQTAIDASIAGDQIVVTDGVYQVGGETATGDSLTNRVVINKPLTVQSVNGPAHTIIKGYHYPLQIYSNMPTEVPLQINPNRFDAIRCVCITTNAALIGFTLINGATSEYLEPASDAEGGGVWCASTNGDVISNCVITANSAYREGGGAYQGTLVNCMVLGNSAGSGGGGVANAAIFRSLIVSNTVSGPDPYGNGNGGGTYDCAVFSSALAENSAFFEGGGAYGGYLANCTVTENSAMQSGGGIASCPATNCIIYYNKIFSNNSSTNYLGYPLSYCCTTPNAGGANITTPPDLADISHISLNSPCRGAGEQVPADTADIDGNPWNDPPSIGCSEIPPAGDYGNLAVAIPMPFTNWAPGYPLDFQASISGPDYMTVWNFGDGTIVTNEPYISHAWTASGAYPVTLTAYNDSYPTGVTETLMMTIAVPKTNYVNWASANPVPPYSYWSTAATNIQNAVNVASPGSTVLVTNPSVLIWEREPEFVTNSVAIYHGGATIQGSRFYVGITNPVTVQSVNGPAKTWIEGSEYSLGCVYLANGAVLSGFTITNGYQLTLPGGGISAASTNAVVTNCIITGCMVGAYSGTFYNCSFIGNEGGSEMSTLNDCILSNNASEYGGGALGGILNNCMIVSNSATRGGGAFGGVIGMGTFPIFLNDCFISNNVARYGGGICGGFGNPGPAITNCIVTNCLITANSANTFGGGATYAQLNNCVISSNKCENGIGGGMASGLANNCLFIGNVAGSGGGASDQDMGPSPTFTVLNNCTLVGNQAIGGGGAFFCTLNHCTVLQNAAEGSPPGGAPALGGGVWDCFANDCQILTNQADYGGGASSGALTNCLLAGNAANYGGGVDGGYSEGGREPSWTVLNHCTVTGNLATNTGGGAIDCTLENCTIADNLSDFAGGGAAYALLSGCTIASNSAFALVPDSRNPISGGGGVYACTVTNSLIANNFATTNGGGAFQSTLVNCTLTANNALIGGGSFNSANDNCILYYNRGGDYYPSTTQYPLNYCCTPISAANGIRNITNAPLFVNPAGGDYHLQSTSPCINSGNDAYITAATDLDGNPRIQGGTVDNGAYEYQTPTSVISYAYLQKYGLPTDGSVDFANLDGTAFNVYQDWVAGLNPTNPASVLAMLAPVTTNTATGVTVTWQSVAGIPYLLQRSTNLESQPPFSIIQNNILGQPNTTSYKDSSATNNVPYFYRVGVVAP